MQTVIQVLSNKSTSLRDRIVKDRKLWDFDLTVSEHQRKDRGNGWAKLHGTNRQHGVANIQWLPSAKVLLCRVVTKGSGDPAPITGDFVKYVISRHKSEILTIVIRHDA